MLLTFLEKSLVHEHMLYLSHFHLYDSNQPKEMKIDFIAINSLNLNQNSEGQKDGTLYVMLDETKSPFGSRKLKVLICKPLKEGREIIERLEAVTELRENLELANLFQYKLQNVIPLFLDFS